MLKRCFTVSPTRHGYCFTDMCSRFNRLVSRPGSLLSQQHDHNMLPLVQGQQHCTRQRNLSPALRSAVPENLSEPVSYDKYQELMSEVLALRKENEELKSKINQGGAGRYVFIQFENVDIYGLEEYVNEQEAVAGFWSRLENPEGDGQQYGFYSGDSYLFVQGGDGFGDPSKVFSLLICGLSQGTALKLSNKVEAYVNGEDAEPWASWEASQKEDLKTMEEGEGQK